MSELKFCENCGARLNSASEFCNVCGKKVEDLTEDIPSAKDEGLSSEPDIAAPKDTSFGEPSPAQIITPEIVGNSPEIKPKKKLLVPIVAAVAFFVLCCIIGTVAAIILSGPEPIENIYEAQGTISGTTYTNDYFDIEYEAPSDWNLLSAEECGLESQADTVSVEMGSEHYNSNEGVLVSFEKINENVSMNTYVKAWLGDNITSIGTVTIAGEEYTGYKNNTHAAYLRKVENCMLRIEVIAPDYLHADILDNFN